jgi:hypothetical protein
VGLSEGDFDGGKVGEGFGEASWMGEHTIYSLTRGARSDVTGGGGGKRKDRGGCTSANRER